jgi:hypothetical protein
MSHDKCTHVDCPVCHRLVSTVTVRTGSSKQWETVVCAGCGTVISDVFVGERNAKL